MPFPSSPQKCRAGWKLNDGEDKKANGLDQRKAFIEMLRRGSFSHTVVISVSATD
jgi:hypothetical protein